MADTGSSTAQASPAVSPQVGGTLPPAKRSKHGRKKDVTTNILNNTIWALENSKTFLSLAPIPGLANAVDGLVAVLDKVAVSVVFPSLVC